MTRASLELNQVAADAGLRGPELAAQGLQVDELPLLEELADPDLALRLVHAATASRLERGHDRVGHVAHDLVDVVVPAGRRRRPGMS